MRCPYCGADRDRVVDSRPAEGGAAIRRRRTCTSCGQRFSTYERVERAALSVRKRHGDLQPFDRDRVLAGIRKATANLDVGDDVIRRAGAQVEARVRRLHQREVASDAIGIEVLAALREIHDVAYVRFASVYKGFTSPEDFLRELRTLERDSHDSERHPR